MAKQRKQTFADDFQGEIDSIDEQADRGGGQRQTFAGDFSAAIKRMNRR